jgi:hypothetical protein
MSEFLTIVSSLLGSAVVSGAISNMIAERFRTRQQQELERTKFELALAQFRFSRLHERAVDAVAGTYVKLDEVRLALASYVSIVEYEGNSQEARRKQLGEKIQCFQDYFRTQRLYLPKSTANKVATFEDTAFQMTREFMIHVEYHADARGASEAKARGEKWIELSNRLNSEIVPLLGELEDEFRRLLDVEMYRSRPAGGASPA